jgi:hypothetical protein
VALNSLKYADRFDLKDVFGDCYKYNSLKLVTGNWNASNLVGGSYVIYTINNVSQPKHVYLNNEKAEDKGTDPFTAGLQWK